MRPSLATRIGFYVGIYGLLIIFLFPILWMLFGSVKTQPQNIAVPPVWIFRPTLENYRQVFQRNDFGRYFVNSLIIGCGATGAAILVGLPAAYSVARYRYRWLALGILFLRMLPGMAFVIPWFVLFSEVGLIGSHLALIIAHVTITLPLFIWIMRGFFEDVPSEIFEAAEVDGCTPFGVFRRIAVPLTVPGTVTVAILVFAYSWNEFMFSLIIGGMRTRTLPVAVYSFMSYGFVEWGGIMAGATVVTLPVLFFVFALQKRLTRGFVGGLGRL